VERRLAAVPLRKAGTTTEVGNAAAWLLSDRASQVSGVVLPVDGGYTA
jgi:enoyl-[acyl-carrier-protein] reductase (NADH)